MDQDYLKIADYTTVIKAASDALRLDPNDKKALLRRCLAFEELGLLERALKDASGLDPENASTNIIVTRLRSSKEKRTQHDYYPLRDKGKFFYGAEQYDLALEAYKETIGLQDLDDDKRAILHSNMAQCYLKECDYEAAVEEATSALSLMPDLKKALYRRCLSYERLGMLEKALADASGLDQNSASAKEVISRLKRLTTEPAMKDFKTLRENGNTLYATGQYDKALEAYKEALRLQDLDDGKQGVLHNNMALCYLKKCDYEAVTESATSALKLMPDDQKALYRRCLAYEKLGQLDNALEDAARLDPDRTSTKEVMSRLNGLTADRTRDYNTLRERGKALYDSGQYNLALAAYKETLGLQDLDGDKQGVLHSNIAQCYLKIRDYEAAVEEATSALKLMPNDEKALYRRCLAHENMGLLENALKDASRMDPDSKLTKKILSRLNNRIADQANQRKGSRDESTGETDESSEGAEFNQPTEMYKKNDPVKIQKLLDECHKHLNKKNHVYAARCAVTVFEGLNFLYTTKFGDRNFLASCYINCTGIFQMTGEHFLALRSFYRGIAFETEWNPQTNHRQRADVLLLNTLDSSIGHGEDLMSTMKDLNELSAYFEKLGFWPAWHQIATDLFFLHEEAVNRRLLNFSQDLYLSCALRRGRGLLKLNDFHGVKKLCKRILNEKFDCMEAYEVWAKSLKNEEKFEYARKKADLALEFSKTETEKRRIKKLIHEIENFDISDNIFDDSRDWLADTNVLSYEQEMERMRSITSHRKSTKRHRPKRTTKTEDFLSADRHLIGNFSTNLSVLKIISQKSKEAKLNQVALHVHVKKPGNTYSYAMTQKPEEWSDSDEDGTESDASMEEIQERLCTENVYDPSIHRADESHAMDDNDLLKLLRSGLQLSRGFVDKFRRKRNNRNFYEKELNASELEKKANSNKMKYKKCKLKIQSAHLAYCSPLDITDPIQTITISGRTKAGQARSDDEVVVELTDEKGQSAAQPRRYGRVLGTLKRCRNENVDHPLFLCTLDANESHLAIPLCKTVPKIHLLTTEIKKTYRNKKQFKMEKYCYDRERQELKFDKITDVNQVTRRNTLYIVVFITWNRSDPYPCGAVIDLLISKGDIDSSLRILDIQHNVQTTYQQDTVEETKAIIGKYSSGGPLGDVLSGRRHVSEMKVFTIDPPGSHDLDDALSIECSNNIFKVGVHIADVSVYIPKGSHIDAEAQRRTTSFYSGLRNVRHMLPEQLSIDLCSLLPGKERPCLSVFFSFNKDANLIDKPTISETIVCSSKQMTYEDVQEIIESGKCDDEIDQAIQYLYLLATQMRRQRLHDSMLSLPIEMKSDENIRDVTEAHFLVEEFMILTNKTISKKLIKRFPNVTPLRRQQEPNKEEIKQWLEKEKEIVDFVLALQGKRIADDKIPSFRSVATCSNKFLTVQDWVWRVLTSKDDNEKDTWRERCQKYIRTDEIHPLQCLAYHGWISHQENAEYVCSGVVVNPENGKHFSLGIYPYTHFTSPIRRYPDLITHRLVHSMIEDKDSPYNQRDVEELCIHINTVQQRQKAYEKNCEMLQLSLRLRVKPLMFNCFIDDVSDSCMSLCIPLMKFKTDVSNTIPFSLLDPNKNPEIIKDMRFSYDLVRLEWRKRLYDARGYSSCITHKETKETQRIDPNRHGVSIPIQTWARALEHVHENKMNEIKNMFANITQDVYTLPTSMETVPDVSTETHRGIVQPFTSFSITLTHGQIVKVQMAADMQNGVLSPIPQLLFITENVQFCMQHMKDPIRCLTQYATNSTSSKYSSIKEYNETWLPLMQMESAMNSVKNEENFTIHNVPIKFKRRTGKFRLTIPFCYERNIDLEQSNNRSESNEEEWDDSEGDILGANDWICVRHKLPHLGEDKDNDSFWIAHGEIKCVKRNKDKQRLTIEFEFHDLSPPVPRIVDRELCTIELLIKTDTHRRMEKCLKMLDSDLSDDELASKIARFLKIPHLDEDYFNVTSSVNPEVDLADCHVKTRNLPRNNDNQKDAIKKALTSRFSLIHGPPGTGKSYTGIKLLYLFNEINKMQEKRDGIKRQILFCGPSNKSVDLVARLSKERLGSKCPKLVRIYGKTIENIDFPIHGRILVSKKSLRDTKSDEKLREISLHYLIRQDGKTYASDLWVFDQKFKKKDYTPTLEEFNEYKSLRYKARVEELKEHEVILCTTAVATNRILHQSSNIWQLVIDEAGMCTEPECLAPIIMTRPKQVVLIGDHMQLQPIINSKHAAELGMSRSLFERYATSKELKKHNIKYTLLNVQYRMNPGLCKFPSKKFYNGRLITEENDDRVLWKDGIKNPLSVWCDPYKPHILCHVEGEETALKASTEEGNEQSRSNLKEIEKVVEVFRHLVNMEGVDSKRIIILSQYNAQCSKLRDHLEKNGFYNFKVSTVVSSQGGEWDYAIFSTVRSLPAHLIEENPTLGWCKQNLGFITDQHQINVALTRARNGIIIIGNMNLLRCDKVWEELIQHYKSHGCIRTAETFPPIVPRMQRRRPTALQQRNY